jgi:hypothetical protein
MGREFIISLEGVRYTMGMVFIMSLEGVRYTTDRWAKYHGYRVRYTVCRGFDIPPIDIMNSLPMVFLPPTHGISNPLLMVF